MGGRKDSTYIEKPHRCELIIIFQLHGPERSIGMKTLHTTTLQHSITTVAQRRKCYKHLRKRL